MSVGQLRDGISGSNGGSDLTGYTNSATSPQRNFVGGDNLTFTPLNNFITFDYNGDGTTDARDKSDLRASVLSLIARYYEPFDIDVRQAAAANIADIQNALKFNYCNTYQCRKI